MNIEMLDGYFAALVCGPELILPNEFLPTIWGKNFGFNSDAEVNEIMGIFVRHWNIIAATLLRTLEEDDVYWPILLEDSDGIIRGNDWALGFTCGVTIRMGSWLDLIDNKNRHNIMLPIMLLAFENDTDLATRPPPFDNEENRVEQIQLMIACLTEIYRFFAPSRQSPPPQTPVHIPLRGKMPKIGRNQPCPCGSGRKYKHCCASNAPTMN